MSDDRTPEQVAADDALTAAIENLWHTHHPEWGNGVITEYLVIAARTSWDDDGDAVTGVMTAPRDNDVPHHRILGLLDYATTRYRARTANPHGD